MKRLKLLAALTLAVTAFTGPAKAHLIDAGGLSTLSDDPAAEAAALESQFHISQITFLGRYVHNARTGAVTFVPGAITDPSQISYTSTGEQSALVSWDLAGTGFENRFVVSTVSGSDFAFVSAYRVTPDEFVNSLGLQPSGGIRGEPFLNLVDFFGTTRSVPDTGPTAPLLASAVVGLGLIRASIAKSESARQIGSGMRKWP